MKYLLITFTSLFVVACSPQSHYVAPQNKSAQLCVQQCKKEKQNCIKDYDSNYQSCLLKNESKAKANYAVSLQKYIEQKARYQVDIKKYESNSIAWKKKTKSINQEYITSSEKCANQINRKQNCQKANSLAQMLNSHYQNKPQQPIEPHKPSLEKEKARITCEQKVNCQKKYDQCFKNCGGVITKQ